MGKERERAKSLVIGRVKELREFLHMTQEAFAESIDVSANTISRIERKDISLSSDVALRIADVHGISLDWLFFRGEEMRSPERLAKLKEALACIAEPIEGEKPRLKLKVCTKYDDE